MAWVGGPVDSRISLSKSKSKSKLLLVIFGDVRAGSSEVNSGKSISSTDGDPECSLERVGCPCTGCKLVTSNGVDDESTEVSEPIICKLSQSSSMLKPFCCSSISA